jgi:threonine dehydratase
VNRLLSNPIPASGVIVASGGNAGIATAAAAKELGVRCEVFVPKSRPPPSAPSWPRWAPKWS